MKTLQEQYNLIKEGKGNKQQFFKSARHLFPDLVTPVNTFEDTVRILKNRGVIAEGIGGVVTKGKTPDWHVIFKENMNSLHEGEPRKGDKVEVDGKKGTVVAAYSERGANFEQYDVKLEDGKEKKGLQAKDLKILKEAKEAKAVEKETTKEVTDMATRGYDSKDTKNYDNVFGQEFLQGYYAEMKDHKNEGKHVEELRQIVAKNLAKDINYYVKNGQFGVKGLGYITDAPGLGEPKPAKGKHKASGYGDLKESVLRSQIYLLVKEVLAEGENKDLLKHRLGVLKAALAYAEKEIKNVDKDSKIYKEVEKTIAGKKREIEALEKEILTELQPEPSAEKEQFGDMVAAKLKSNAEALKYFNQNETNITDTFLDHSKPEGGVDDAVAHILKQTKAAPLSEKKKPSAGLTKKEKSAISKKAHAGGDIGEKGKGFEKVAKAAEKQYGSKEAGEKVAAAAMWKSQAAKK